jgi:hypothetical protein
MKRVALFFAVLLLFAIAAVAQETPTPSPSPTPTPAPAVDVHGFVDVDYAWNPNRPPDHDNFIPGTGSTARHGNELGLNLAALTLSHAPDPVGFTLVLNAGSGTDVNAGEPANGRDVYRAIYQASVNYEPGRPGGVQVEAGVFPCHVGFEGFFSKDNWNYTRSWLGEFSPYYSAGVKVGFPLGEHFRAQVHVLNGWQIIRDNNDAKTVGTQLLWSSDRFSAAFNTMYGAELPGDESSKRAFGDLWLSFKATPSLTVVASFDAGRQEFPEADTAKWWGAAAYARFAISDATAVALRAERFDDPDGGIAGSPQRLDEATLTLEHRPRPNLILKLEGRYDRAEDPVFRDKNGLEDSQFLLLLGAVAVF